MLYIRNRSSAFRRIARDLALPVVYPHYQRRVFRRRPNRISCIVNIGCSHVVWDEDTTVLNRNIDPAVSKLQAFQLFTAAGISCPQVMTAEEATQSGVAFLGRRDGLSQGQGITVYNAGDVPAQHTFYVKTIPCRREFRVHVWRGEIICIQKKRLAAATSVIHNHSNGVLFQVVPLEEFNIGTRRTQQIKELAINAVQALGLDFGAVDILQEAGTDKLYVLEVNTAPGISSIPVYNAYKTVIENLIENRI